jgi:hypothetical protein
MRILILPALISMSAANLSYELLAPAICGWLRVGWHEPGVLALPGRCKVMWFWFLVYDCGV